MRSILEGSGESSCNNIEEVFVDLFGIFGIFFVFNMVDKELKIIQEKVLVVRRRVKVIFKYFFRELYISEVFDDEFSILNNDISDDIDVGSEHSQYCFIKVFGIVVFFSSQLKLNMSHESLQVFYFIK